jgi:hypothetical protein
MKKLLLGLALLSAIGGAASAQSYSSPSWSQHDNGPSYMSPYYCQYWASRGRWPANCAPYAGARKCWRVKNRNRPGYHTVCR